MSRQIIIDKDKHMKALASSKLEILDDSPYVDVRVNNSEPLWFNVDSGASACVIDLAQCENLSIPIEGQYEGTGAGSGSFKYSKMEGVRYSLGNETFTADQSYAIDLSGVANSKGRRLDGILGCDFFLRYVVVLDYSQSVMTLYDPDGYVYRGSGEVLEITFVKKVPFVKGRIWVPGVAAKESEWLVDTGSSDTLNDELLGESKGAVRHVMGGRGLGKEFETLLATADRVEIGPFHFEKVEGATGGMKIGGGLLRYFTVTFDYSKSQMILEPNQQYPN